MQKRLQGSCVHKECAWHGRSPQLAEPASLSPRDALPCTEGSTMIIMLGHAHEHLGDGRCLVPGSSLPPPLPPPLSSPRSPHCPGWLFSICRRREIEEGPCTSTPESISVRREATECETVLLGRSDRHLHMPICVCTRAHTHVQIQKSSQRD